MKKFTKVSATIKCNINGVMTTLLDNKRKYIFFLYESIREDVIFEYSSNKRCDGNSTPQYDAFARFS